MTKLYSNPLEKREFQFSIANMSRILCQFYSRKFFRVSEGVPWDRFPILRPTVENGATLSILKEQVHGCLILNCSESCFHIVGASFTCSTLRNNVISRRGVRVRMEVDKKCTFAVALLNGHVK